MFVLSCVQFAPPSASSEKKILGKVQEPRLICAATEQKMFCEREVSLAIFLFRKIHVCAGMCSICPDL